MSDFDRMDGGRSMGCGGILITLIFMLGVPTMIYGFICWVIHWYQMNQLPL